MSRNIHILFFCLAFAPGAVIAQTEAPAIVKAIKDPKAKENSAKADVYVQDKRIIATPPPEKKKKKCKRNPTK
jgi:hypothetical protein